MTQLSRNFYLFLGFHSFLLGLFPFFLPVYLYKEGVSLAAISWFVALTGLGFCITLWGLDRVRSKSIFIPVLVSFVLESCLLFLMVSGAPLPLVALVNGSYSCLYWTIQRILFLEGGGSEDSGRRFGNFQIVVLVVLKTGIFIGSLLLDNFGVWVICLLSLVVGCAGILLSYQYGRGFCFPASLQQQEPLGLKTIVRFSDTCNSRFIFAIDGIFLYMESYFWLISLFLVVGESFVRLGVLVIALAIILGMLFYFIKNRIDRINRQQVYVSATFLYIFSWGLRASLSDEMSRTVQLSLLLVIAFCTSFFRLAFNKRFFDIARWTSRYEYLFIKSYYSQMFLAIGFAIIGWCAISGPAVLTFLKSCYWICGLTAVGYLFYLPIEQGQKQKR